MISSVDGLTQMPLRFAEEYAIDLNGAQAAIRAGYSPKTARTSSFIESRTTCGQAGHSEGSPEMHMDGDPRLVELTALAFGNPLDDMIWDPDIGLIVNPESKLVKRFRRVTRTDSKTALPG